MAAAPMGVAEQVVDAWRIHSRIVLYLLEAIPEESMGDAAVKRGRTVAATFRHLHVVRLMYLKVALPALLEGLPALDVDEALPKAVLEGALGRSADAIAELLRSAVESRTGIRGFKPHPGGFLGYLISHEAYHMGKIDLILRMKGHALPDKAHYGMWEWGCGDGEGKHRGEAGEVLRAVEPQDCGRA